jgi:phosphoribosylformylglycinamidine synthase
MGQIGATLSSREAGAGSHLKDHEWLFSESQSRIIVTFREENLPKLEQIANNLGVPFAVLGRVGGERLVIDGRISLAIDEIAHKWQGALECMIKSERNVE